MVALAELYLQSIASIEIPLVSVDFWLCPKCVHSLTSIAAG
jgi:hypothetical protein